MLSLEIYNFVLGCNEKLVSSSEGKGISQVIYQASPLFSICKKKKTWFEISVFFMLRGDLIIFSLILR